MAIIKCKMCGGDIEMAADKTYGMCEFCGSTMTLPKIDDDQRAAAFNRGNHFRRIGEFDKALAVYERIVSEDNTDAEAHWCCALCRFGIEYVEDPASFEWVPTCHRASFDSFLEDVDYLAAVEHSEGVTKRQYQKDAARIAEVQRGILATSQNSEPYDVFICYKESDENGDRTADSVIAQDIYDRLTEKGYKVFFARITLEDKLGSAYEPYIFAALNSARVMLVVGTRPEYFNAVWVKNEWSRYIALMEQGQKNALIPCYRDMTVNDMPKEFRVLQSQDISKLGYMQDLLRGIDKILGVEKVPVQKATQVRPVPTARKKLISSVVTVPANNGDDTFPKNPISSTVNKDRFPAVAFHATLNRTIGEYRSVDVAMTVLDDMDNVVHSSSTMVSAAPDNDKFSRVWLLRGSDGSSVSDGIYRVRMSVDGSEEMECKFRVISSGDSASYYAPPVQQPQPQPTYTAPQKTVKTKKWGIYLLLNFFLGMFGIHSFYAGRFFKGLLQLILTCTGAAAWVTAIWVILDFFKALFSRKIPLKEKKKK